MHVPPGQSGRALGVDRGGGSLTIHGAQELWVPMDRSHEGMWAYNATSHVLREDGIWV